MNQLTEPAAPIHAPPPPPPTTEPESEASPALEASFPPASPPGVVVLGRDEAGRPHASAFAPDEREPATRAAALMNFQVLPMVGAVEALAARLPRGRLFASGRGFVPFVKAELFEELLRCEGVVTPPAPEPSDQVVVLATVKAKRKKAKAVVPPEEPVRRPASWDDIQAGDLVLVCEGLSKGWWEVEVLGHRGDDVFVVRFWDFPDEPPFVRRRDQLALTPPGFVEVVEAA